MLKSKHQLGAVVETCFVSTSAILKQSKNSASVLCKLIKINLCAKMLAMPCLLLYTRVRVSFIVLLKSKVY